jgi:predicted nucleotidyltransferase
MPAPDRVFRADEILRILCGHRVDFVVVGGIAVMVHGYIRNTKDLDIVVRPETLNLSRLSEALAELEAEPRGVAAINLTDPHQLRPAPLVPIMTNAGPLDVVNIEHLAGAPASYDALREAALTVKLGGLEVAVAALRDLIRMKRAAGREHDLADIEALTRRPGDRADGGREST